MAKVNVDTEQAYADLQLGILVRRELGTNGGTAWRRKDGTYPAFSFSLSLVELAGGVEKLLTDWEKVAV